MSLPIEWKLKDLKKLKVILEKTPVDDIEAIQRQIPIKTKEQIEDLIAKLRNAAPKNKRIDTEAPIESWLTLAAQLVFRDDIDHSENLSRALSLISDHEEFNTNNEEFKPDYKLVYKYLAAILQGSDTLPSLPSVECAIVLDLMHSLADILKTKSTSGQQRIMQWKHRLLTCKTDINQKLVLTELHKKALNNDFSDLLNPDNKTKLGQKRKREDTAQCSSSTQANLDEEDGATALDSVEHESEDNSVSSEPEDIPLKKPKFLTLNPLCIPVSLLKLKDLNNSDKKS
ncbi:hypothetical protein LOTGIDRAFT_230568 [Lottia gigantea]|uniref:Uncharacterized protein n=1 Tax=Lottia gigantea TaxID=225164 RepID=V4B422_LOTGI|nr:hypothetical protein LOTGIDRAFT_230568 [Lottia gigantea]ESP02176.1 hypothetical protein LOTGIDRAFT_230568 [Lottia gigantea]